MLTIYESHLLIQCVVSESREKIFIKANANYNSIRRCVYRGFSGGAAPPFPPELAACKGRRKFCQIFGRRKKIRGEFNFKEKKYYVFFFSNTGKTTKHLLVAASSKHSE